MLIGIGAGFIKTDTGVKTGTVRMVVGVGARLFGSGTSVRWVIE